MQLRFTFFSFLILITGFIEAQIVNEEVYFDYYQSATDNDFVNHFTGGYGMSQIQTNGITGGCLLTPDSISWGNDNAIYCSYYKPSTGDTLVTSLSFKYDSTTVNVSSFQRAISIFMRPLADYNHYIIASVSGNEKIELLTYGWNNNPYPPLTLHHEHWYRYILTVVINPGDEIIVSADVFDLGTTGTDVPTIVNSSVGSFIDNVLSIDTSIQVSITGTTYGGAGYLDDFGFKGPLGVTNCINIPTGISDEPAVPELAIYPSPASDEIRIDYTGDETSKIKLDIISLSGERIKILEINLRKTSADISMLPPGMYILRYTTPSESGALPLMVVR